MATLTARFPDASHAREAIDHLVARSFAPSRFRIERTLGRSRPVPLIVEPGVLGGAAVGTALGFGLVSVAVIAAYSFNMWMPLGFANAWLDTGFALVLGSALGFIVGGFGGLNTWSVRPSRDLVATPDESLTVHYRGPHEHMAEAATVMRELGATNMVTYLS